MPWFADAATDLLLGGRCVGCSRPGRVLCARCADGLPRAAYPAWPTPTPPGLAPPWAAAEYAGVVRAAVLAHKEDAAHGLRRPLAGLLTVAVCAALVGRDAPARPARPGSVGPGEPVVLVPVPSRPGVARSRGHDPMRTLAHLTARDLRRREVDVRVVPLLRSRGGADQAGLDSEARADNLAGSLCCPSPAVRRLGLRLPRARVLVCDDVLTTGATAREAQRALEAAGIRVSAIVTVAATRKFTASLPSPRSVG